MPQFTATLSVSSIKRLQKELKNYKEHTLKQKIELFTRRLAERGVEIAKSQIVGLDATFEGDLLASVHLKEGESTKDKCVFYVVADDESALFVEVGTGLIGASSQYPGKLPVMYAQGKKFTTLQKPFKGYPAGTYGWFYYKNGELWFTEGMPSRPFMFNTANELRQSVIEEVAREVFG